MKTNLLVIIVAAWSCVVQYKSGEYIVEIIMKVRIGQFVSVLSICL